MVTARQLVQGHKRLGLGPGRSASLRTSNPPEKGEEKNLEGKARDKNREGKKKKKKRGFEKLILHRIIRYCVKKGGDLRCRRTRKKAGGKERCPGLGDGDRIRRKRGLIAAYSHTCPKNTVVRHCKLGRRDGGLSRRARDAIKN